MYKHVTYDDAINNRIYSDSISKRIAILLPAYNEEDSIGKTLDSISYLKVPKDIVLDVFIALDNCTDNTDKVIETYRDRLNLYVLDTVNNKERKSGALNQLYRLFFGDSSENAQPLSSEHLSIVDNIVAFLGIDADVYMDRDCLSTLYTELNSRYNIGGVSANYTCLYPESKRRIRRDSPNSETELANAGGSFARFLTAQQNKSFAEWTLQQKNDNFTASVLGGQCSLFRPKALKEVYETYKLNCVFDNDSETEDLLLTQQIRALKWRVVISRSARCYVDSMKDFNSYTSQQKKWTIGKLDYTVKAKLSTTYAFRNWLDELTLFMNGAIRIMLLILIPASIALGDFKWSWFWALPIAFSVILNTIVALKMPNRRFIDVILSMTTISSEFSIWFDLYIHIKSWRSLMKSERDDAWAEQYASENGAHSSHIGVWALVVLFFIVVLGLYTGVISLNTVLIDIKPYISTGFKLLTFMTGFTTILVLNKLFKVRGSFKA